MKIKEQLSFLETQKETGISGSYLDKLITLLQNDLDFHNRVSNYSSHNFHSFPAKFPPQLPKIFVDALTSPEDTVLDPMVGSGTTIIEAYLSGRKSIGFDIDPLAIRIAKAKTTPLNKQELKKLARKIYTETQNDLSAKRDKIKKELDRNFDPKSKSFLEYWFLPEIQIELFALLQNINRVNEENYRNFFEVVFSSIIITKSGGVSLALDLGHTRPHKTKILLDRAGNVIFGGEYLDNAGKSRLSKIIKFPLEEFEKRFLQNLNSLIEGGPNVSPPEIRFGDSQNLDLGDCTVDLIVTSPPYASNAIDYMRAHKFSLVWFGYKIEDLSVQRNNYIGAESTTKYIFEPLPDFTERKVREIATIDTNRGNVLRRYYSEMTQTLREMFRVLKPGKAAIVVVGSSIMKGIDTETNLCLEDIGKNIGFKVPHIGVRKLDRNKRMLPTGFKADLNSQIQKRMHIEYVIGFYKPEN